MIKIPVTGAASYIGFHLSRRLLERGVQVVGFDNLNDYYDDRLKQDRLKQLIIKEGFRFVNCSLVDRETVERLFVEGKFYRVINLATQAGVRYSLQNPQAYISRNIDGFMNIRPAFFHCLQLVERARHGSVTFSNCIQEEQLIDVFSHGKMQRDFNFIDDIVNEVDRVCDRIPMTNTAWIGSNPDPGGSYARTGSTTSATIARWSYSVLSRP